MNIIENKSERETMLGTATPLIDGHILFKNVHFAYPQRSDIEVLKGINIISQPNETIAFVGSSGAGKSTIANLLLRYFEPNSGEIVFSNTNIKEIDVHHLRASMAYVPQEVILFGGTIEENISYGKTEASFEEIKQAAKQANALDFIESFPEGFQTQVGDRGIQLSGGQKQRIAIARALLKNPKILILDEATSALDSESEKLVQEALERLMQGRTSFVIAHRLSTIRNATKIMVLDQGKIVEEGSHDELIQIENGIYTKLIQLQH